MRFYTCGIKKTIEPELLKDKTMKKSITGIFLTGLPTPEMLNLRSKGRWIMCLIRPPEDYNVADIDPNSVFLENEIKPQRFWLSEDNQIAIAKFDRSEVQSILEVGDINLTITGQLTDGTIFEGTDIIKVIDKVGKKSAK